MSILSFDIGTTGVKTCLYDISEEGVLLLDTAYSSYPIYFLPGGGAEQDPHEWWKALCETSREIAKSQGEKIKDLEGISFCSQMQSLVLVDEKGLPIRRAMSYMDQRASEIKSKVNGRRPKIAGVEVSLLLKSLYHTGVVAASDKDPLWKYLWVKEYEPEVFKKIHKWLDVKEALIARMTGEFVMSEDSAFATLLMDKDSSHPHFSTSLLKTLKINPDHLPTIVKSIDEVGTLTEEAAKELGLPQGVKVFAGGGDASLVSLGAGTVFPGEAHVYMGTSGWSSVITDKRTVDTKHMMASVVGVQPGLFNYFAELETAGKCLEWVKDHLALDEINIYLKQENIADDPTTRYENLYEYLSEVIETIPAGSGGVIFLPWLHGNRCPFEDAYAKGSFFNIGLETGKTELIRSVIEGVCYHLRWFFDVIKEKLPVHGTIRFVGGGALSDTTAQILADVLKHPIEVTKNPQNVGALGASYLAACGLGIFKDLKYAARFTPVEKRFEPNPSNFEVHDKNFEVFKEFYPKNKKLFHLLNKKEAQ